ncbi:S26 family signal peptidase [Natrinema longum]|uniref:S26 family signal peptidase n=1 Tax=Natrinema longum TaxID=370324 RepID=A0A8A2UDX3_9EURY|nr:S26 family signal peptidase [Natrinema longum]MBZ6495175.1 S26 family signal peptidase [Natrinema longum]QSW86843.1 S26 family signal peptidase [Natrinema longum]
MSGPNPGEPPGDSGDDDSEQHDRRAEPSHRSPAPEESSRDGPDADRDPVTIEDDGILRWFLNTDDETVMITRDVLSSVAIVAVVGLLLFAVSGIWPPLVAVESPSMTPNMQEGDLIFVVDDDRFGNDAAVEDTGVVTLENGRETGYEKFGKPGDVIIYQPNGDPTQTPVIHRAHFWVEEDENWVETKADEDVIGDATCAEVDTCRPDHAGFVTKGDANSGYDQYGNGISDVVKPEWVTGKAMFRIPWLGHIRLTFDRLFGGTLVPTSPASQPLQGPTPATAGPIPAGPGATGVAGVVGIASAGAVAVMAIGRSRR